MGVLDARRGQGVFVRVAAAEAHLPAERERMLDDLCRDFVARGQILGIGMGELIERLEAWRR